VCSSVMTKMMGLVRGIGEREKECRCGVAEYPKSPTRKDEILGSDIGVSTFPVCWFSPHMLKESRVMPLHTDQFSVVALSHVNSHSERTKGRTSRYCFLWYLKRVFFFLI